jgi:membrane protease subunit HflC
MKRNTLTLAIGILLVVIFLFQMCFFQVRQTEVALVTTFGKPTREEFEPGLKTKWPWPIQRVLKFDKRVQNLEDTFEQNFTSDGRNIIITVYAGWRISNASVFRERFAGSIIRAENELKSVVRSAKDGVVGSHPFSHFVSTDPNELQFDEIESKMLARVQPQVKDNYGVEIEFLGIKKLGLPESTTEKVFERMTQERQVLVDQLEAEGAARASDIRSEARRQREEILAEADAKVRLLLGEADAQAAENLAVFEQNPELAIFLLKVDALPEILKQLSTLILDTRTPGLDLLDGSLTNSPVPSSTR